MLYYVTRRILLFIPTLLIISLLSFWLNSNAPGDPIEILVQSANSDGGLIRDINDEDRIYKNTASILGLDKPTFYFRFGSAAYPDTLYQIYSRTKRQVVSQLIDQSGNWPVIEKYYSNIKSLDFAISNLPDSLKKKTSYKRLLNNTKQLYLTSDTTIIVNKINVLKNITDANQETYQAIIPGLNHLMDSHQAIDENPQKWKHFTPRVHWYGFDNQYHNWITSFFKGDFGISYQNGQQVSSIIWSALKRTILLNSLAVIFALGIAIPIGIKAATSKGKAFDRYSTLILFILYSMPSFWLGTLLLIFLTTPEYGLDWFPTFGLESDSITDDSTFWERFWDRVHHLILPVFTLTYGSIAFISRQMRRSMSEELEKPYITLAYAKGLSQKEVIGKHAFKNALFPIITLVGNIIPFLFAGSFIVEFIFNINGMGLVTIKAIRASDWPTINAILMLSAILTILGIFIADLLYKTTDPRVTFTNKK